MGKKPTPGEVFYVSLMFGAWLCVVGGAIAMFVKAIEMGFGVEWLTTDQLQAIPLGSLAIGILVPFTVGVFLAGRAS